MIEQYLLCLLSALIAGATWESGERAVSALFAFTSVAWLVAAILGTVS